MVDVRALDAPATDVRVDYEWMARVAWKSEYTPTVCEDRYQVDPEHGLFALADGLGMMSNAALWAQLLGRPLVSRRAARDRGTALHDVRGTTHC